MKRYAGSLFTAVLMISLLCSCANPLLAENAISRMEKEELRQRMGTPDLFILDARSGSDWDDSDQVIQGAVRANPRNFSQWAEAYPKEATIVLY